MITDKPAYEKSKVNLLPTRLYRVPDVRLLELPRFARADGEVVVADRAELPFVVARMFTLTAPIGSVRGDHGHRHCTQFMVCVHGMVEIICDDGQEQKTIVLDRNNLAVCVPPTIWNRVIFKKDRSVVVVLCDLPFEERDYLREYSDFLVYRRTSPA